MSVGRNTILTEELFKKIKDSILDGNDLRETAKVCGINEGTLYVWHSDNYLNIKDKIEGWHRDRKLMKAEKKIEELIYSEDEKVSLNASTFIAKTLGKATYSERTEITGKDGKDLLPKPMVDVTKLKEEDGVFNNNSNEEDSEAREED